MPIPVSRTRTTQSPRCRSMLNEMWPPRPAQYGVHLLDPADCASPFERGCAIVASRSSSIAGSRGFVK